jgi:hypothetical protein
MDGLSDVASHVLVKPVLSTVRAVGKPCTTNQESTMRLLALTTAACLVLPITARSESNTIYERWRNLQSSWLGGEFTLKCDNDLKVSRSINGTVRVHFLDPGLNWKQLNVVSVSDAGLDFDGLGYKEPPVTSKIRDLMSSLVDQEVKPSTIYSHRIRVVADSNGWYPIKTRLNFVKGTYTDTYKDDVSFKATWNKDDLSRREPSENTRTELSAAFSPGMTAEEWACQLR